MPMMIDSDGSLPGVTRLFNLCTVLRFCEEGNDARLLVRGRAGLNINSCAVWEERMVLRK